jgi:hypothetical protein
MASNVCSREEGVMSTLTVEDLLLTGVATPAVTRARRWRHVSKPRGPIARPMHPIAPGGRPLGVGAPRVAAQPRVAVAEGSLQLTRRGLAVVVGLFLTVCVVAMVVLVAGFLAVPNDPVVPTGVGGVVSTQG